MILIVSSLHFKISKRNIQWNIEAISFLVMLIILLPLAFPLFHHLAVYFPFLVPLARLSHQLSFFILFDVWRTFHRVQRYNCLETHEQVIVHLDNGLPYVAAGRYTEMLCANLLIPLTLPYYPFSIALHSYTFCLRFKLINVLEISSMFWRWRCTTYYSLPGLTSRYIFVIL